MNPILEAIFDRQALRKFSSREVPTETIVELIELANRAPSGFNLQPWHFVLVRDPALKELLFHVALNQAQVKQSPATVVFVADPRAWHKSYDAVLTLGIKEGAITHNYARFTRRNVKLFFQTGPLGIIGFAKRIIIPLRRLRRPTPNVITSAAEATAYVASQTMLAAENFMIAAKASGLETCPMEGFDEVRLKTLLKIPHYMHVPLIISVGHPLEGDEKPRSVRLPLAEKLHFDQFGRKL